MITLLLAFFVMLQTMAKTKDNTLMKATERSFITALNRMGLPDYFFPSNQRDKQVDYRKLRYPDQDPVPQGLAPPILREQFCDPVAKAFDEVARHMKTDSSDNARALSGCFGLDLKGLADGKTLTDADKAAIASLAGDLADRSAGGAIEVLVMAAAPGEKDAESQYAASAIRSAVVQRALAEALRSRGAERSVKVASCGVGAGGFFGKAVKSSASPVVVAVLHAK
jgi:hypothetical protein